ncbi:hypothetical protein RIF29_41704 [Crotalaria pallida]|uniref:XS domain-containing protein n=1 Tax=Crotalaria pallida TaxID=3830 RepID=A0AAN9E5Y9_CROPI
MNTRSQRHLSEKWSGMGNQGLLDRFHNYAALKARQAYGPQGHRGMGVLIFDTSAAGYLEAVRLHKHFKEQGRDREAWNHCKNPFGPDGKRQLYGYLASREDMDIFNQHSRGRSRLKFEMRSYQEMVESNIKDINEDSRQLNYYKNKMVKEQMKSQVPKDSFCEASENLCLEIEEYRVVRGQTKEQNQQRKGKMGEHESFFQKQIQLIEQAIAEADEFKKSQEGTTGDEPYCLDSAFYERHRRRLQEVCSMMRSKQEHFQKEQKELEKGSASERRQNK